MISSGVERFSNIEQLTEDNFNITPENVDIWRGDIPYKTGDVFPPENVKNRANEYLTNKQLYKNRLNGVLDNVFSWSDYQMNPITNWPNLAICADLPDWYTCTESWVSILASTAPTLETSIDVDDVNFSETADKLRKLSVILKNTNFAEVWQDIVRLAYVVYGNKVVRVSKTKDGIAKIDNMPVKCWIPFINESNMNSIECNLFFNIFHDDSDNIDKVEFIAYVEDGTIIKKTFKYLDGHLGEQIGDTEFGMCGEGENTGSPIVVFKGFNMEGSVFGESQFKYWDASIASAMRNFEAMGVLVEQAKEIIRLIPDGATKHDDFIGVTYQNRTGAIAYTDLEHPPIVEYKKVTIQLDQVLNAYKESIGRVSRDTGLPATFFDTRDIKVVGSGVALKQFMYRTEIIGNSIASNFQGSLKKLVSKIADASGLDINDTVFDVKINNTAIMVDETTKANTIMSRVGNVPTMELYDAIKQLDNVSIDLAVKRAAKLKGIKVENIDESVVDDDNSGENINSDSVDFTASENSENIQMPLVSYPSLGVSEL